jgi:formate/nitrite transporter FocA (FNT family)
LLGVATTLALTGTAQTGAAIVVHLIFPVGFVMIVLLGLELVTGNFAVVPLGVLERKITMTNLWWNWSWVFLGNLLGSLLYAMLFAKNTDIDGAAGEIADDDQRSKDLRLRQARF